MPNGYRAVGYGLIASVLWGVIPITSRLIWDTSHSLLILNSVLSALIVGGLIYGRRIHFRKLTRHELLLLIGIGLSFGVFTSVNNILSQRITLDSMLFASYLLPLPFGVIIYLASGKWTPIFQVIGLGIAGVGAYLLLNQLSNINFTEHSFGISVLIAIIPLALGSYAVMVNHVAPHINPLLATFAALVGSAIGLAVSLDPTLVPPTNSLSIMVILLCGLQIVLQSVAVWFWSRALMIGQPTAMMVTWPIQIAVSTVVGYILLNEQLPDTTFLGATLVIAGALISPILVPLKPLHITQDLRTTRLLGSSLLVLISAMLFFLPLLASSPLFQVNIPSLQMPAEAQEQVFQGGYTILSSQQSSAPQNLRWGLGLSNRDYEEVWCVTAQNALGTSGLLVVRRGRLWSIVYPENVPPGNTPDVLDRKSVV